MTTRSLPPRMSKEKHAERRKGLMEYRREVTEGFDLVAMALENPKQLSEQQRLALLGRAPYTYDQMVLVQKVTNNRFGSAASLVSAAYNWYCNLDSPADCKLMLCDVRHLDDPSQLDAEYAAQLRAEAEQTPEERAREAVRTLSEKRARRNARRLLPELEKLTAEELHELAEKRAGSTIWRRVEPALPEWINDIMTRLFHYGFAYYRSKEVSDRFGDKFEAVWKRLERQASSIPPYDGQETIVCRAGVFSIYKSGCLESAINEVEWSEYQATEDDLSSIRRHFQGARDKIDPDSGILTNTFIVLTLECIHRDLFTAEELSDLPTCWVWAYDADWEPPPGAQADDDGYEGRVKVPIACLHAWFYGARVEAEYDMKQLWKKAQSHPEQLYVCCTLPLEEWNHEPYV